MTTNIASGLGSAFGVVPEVTYGTLPGSPTWRFHDTKDKLPDLKMVKNTAQGGGLAAGRMVDPVARRVLTSQAGTISSIPYEVLNNKMGILLNMIFGGTPTVVQQSTSTAWLQTFALADNVGKSFDAQGQLVTTDGTVRPYTGRGGKVTSAEFTCDLDGLLMASISADFKQVLETDALAAPAYTAAQWPFHFGLMGVKVGAFGSEAVASGVRKVSCKIDRPQSLDRFYANSGGLKSEPLMNDKVAISGSLDVDFVDKTQFADKFAVDGNTSLILSWVGLTAIASTFFPTFQLAMPAVFFNDGTPTQDDKGVQKTTFNYVAQYDETHAPITCTYMSTDVAL